jgi:hypothetical protein
MPPKKPATLRNWRIALIKSTPAAPIGHVDAPDAEFEIKNLQKWMPLQCILLVVALIALFAVMLSDAEKFWPNLLIFMSLTLMALGLALD